MLASCRPRSREACCVDKDDTTERAMARRVAEAGWGLRGLLSPIQGQARQTWRIANCWLTAVDDSRFKALRREHRLLQELRREGTCSDLGINVPKPLLTKSGEYEFVFAGRVWRVTRHLSGVRPNDDLPTTYVEAALALAKVHRALRSFPSELAVGDSVITGLRSALERTLHRNWETVTTDRDERSLVEAVADVLDSHLVRLENAPGQLIHGDWATPNLLVNDPDVGVVTGVLDWEFCTVGPIVADLATLASTVLMWSKLPAKQGIIQSIVDTYAGDIDVDLLGVAIAAKWFRNYWWAREDLERTGWESAVDVMNRQPLRLRATLAYIDAVRGV
jgi:Ser/Thr protein kinase RdoA (MazF antagonist)